MRPFRDVDAVLSPTTPGPAPRADGLDFLESIREITRFTYAWSFADVPALAVPCGFTRDGLPLRFQLASRWFDDRSLLRLGHAFRRQTDCHLRRPSPRA